MFDGINGNGQAGQTKLIMDCSWSWPYIITLMPTVAVDGQE
jgi:hypothetical protein